MKFWTPFLAAVLCLCAASVASAQDRWTGFYVGGNAGAAFGASNVTTSPSNDTYFDPDNVPVVARAGKGSIRTTGFTGGGQAGYNMQSGNLVFGGEVGFDALSLSGSRTATNVPYASGCCTFTIKESVRTNWLLTARPRIGWAFGPSNSWLVDVSAGLAVTDLGSSNVFLDVPGGVNEAASKTQTKIGWTAGTSLAYALDNHWSAKFEYLFVDFGGVSSNGTGAGFGQTFRHSADLEAHIVRAAINYKF